MHAKIIAVGKLKERMLDEKCREFAKWLSPYAKVELLELPDAGADARKEKAYFLKALEKESGSYLIAMTEEGRLMSSFVLAEHLGAVGRKIVFLIGGPNGLDGELKDKADLLLSLSPLTFTHEIARFLLFEQLYRASSILRGGKYHRD